MKLSFHVSSVISILLGVATAAPTATAPPESVSNVYTRDGTTFHSFEHEATGARMEFVNNSGICETTPGVKQYSGYISVGKDMNMFFWFFESRKDPGTAPLALWVNGGPGCSSLIGLFQENGPCRFVNGETKPSLNPYSWNEYANMLYVTQPVGTGFSFGRNPVTSTVTAAPYVWTLLQVFFMRFPQYESRDFGIFTESYGGHYGPEFVDYIQKQNSAIASGKLQGEKINLVALGINNGWIDPITQFKSYITYAYQNPYRRLINATERDALLASYNARCAPELRVCDGLTGKDGACASADRDCLDLYVGIKNSTDFDVYDVRAPSDDPNPPSTFADYLNDPNVKRRIGARGNFQDCTDGPYYKFQSTGDDARSFKKVLEKVLGGGIRVLLWAGTADWICNAEGNYNVVQSVSWSRSAAFASKALAPYTVDGKTKGQFKTVDNLSWLSVDDAGHEVPFYQPEASLQVFRQTMMKQPLQPT